MKRWVRVDRIEEAHTSKKKKKTPMMKWNCLALAGEVKKNNQKKNSKITCLEGDDIREFSIVSRRI